MYGKGVVVVSRRKEECRENRKCAFCGNIFSFLMCYEKEGKNAGTYCSNKCRDEGKKKKRLRKECMKCHKEFFVPKSRASRKYCSLQCSGNNKSRITKTCVTCGDKYDVNKHREETSKCCSFQCLIEYNATINRKGKLNARNRLIRKSWQETRKKVLERDGHVCKVCGSNKTLHVHHIVKWRESKDDSESNLITLCASCHFTVEFLDPDLIKEQIETLKSSAK